MAAVGAREACDQGLDALWKGLCRQLFHISEDRDLLHQAIRHASRDDIPHARVNLAEGNGPVPGPHSNVQAEAPAEQVERLEALGAWRHLAYLLCHFSILLLFPMLPQTSRHIDNDGQTDANIFWLGAGRHRQLGVEPLLLNVLVRCNACPPIREAADVLRNDRVDYVARFLTGFAEELQVVGVKTQARRKLVRAPRGEHIARVVRGGKSPAQVCTLRHSKS